MGNSKKGNAHTRTTDREKIARKADKMRQMSDSQLVHYVEDRESKAYSEGYNDGMKNSGKD